jgi:CheY-like chemotaxis protein
MSRESRHHRILIVDDDAETCRLIAELIAAADRDI